MEFASGKFGCRDWVCVRFPMVVRDSQEKQFKEGRFTLALHFIDFSLWCSGHGHSSVGRQKDLKEELLREAERTHPSETHASGHFPQPPASAVLSTHYSIP